MFNTLPPSLIESHSRFLAWLSSQLSGLSERLQGHLSPLDQELLRQGLLALLVSGVSALALWVFPPVQWLETRLFDVRLYFQGQHPLRSDLILLQIEHQQEGQLLQKLETLPQGTLKAIGIDAPQLFDANLSTRLARLSKQKKLPIVVSAPLERNAAGQPERIYRHGQSLLREGFADYPPDQDGTIRRQPLLLRYRPEAHHAPTVLPSFSWQLYRQLAAQAGPWPSESYLAYPGARAHYTPLTLQAFGARPAQDWQGKILLISDKPPLLRGRTPFQASVRPLELHAHALAGLLDQRTYRRPVLLNTLLPFLLSVLALLVLWQTLRWGLLVASCALGMLALSYFTLNLLLFQGAALWLDLSTPLGAASAASAVVLLHFHRTEGHARRALYNTFRRHLPAQVVKALLERPGEVLTQNERRIVTVMFTDIQGFSRMGEKLPPDQIIRILNAYFAAMTDIVFANQGVLDKYIGDGMMVVYGNIGSNNPRQDALYAVKTALEMQNKMAELQKKWMNEGIRPIQIRIGINTGEALVGHVGHPDHKEMTVIGDTVNTAARIEKLNKQYHTHILISHNTYEYVKDNAEVRALGEERLQGKTSSVMVYEIKGWKAQQTA